MSCKTLNEIKILRSQLRTVAYNAVIDLQGAMRSAVVGRLTGCPRLIGEAAPREAAAGWLFSERIATHGAHVIEQDVELASAVAGDALIAGSGPGCRLTPPPKPGATHCLHPAEPGRSS